MQFFKDVLELFDKKILFSMLWSIFRSAQKL